MDYTQCELRKDNSIDTAWIPSRFARVGNFLKIKKENKWENGWEVIKVFSTLSRQEVMERNLDYRKISTFERK